MSIDGYLDTATDEPLVPVHHADLDRVDAVRADSDAIRVGAPTLRNDNPRLLMRAPSRRAERIARGLPPTPIKVTVTRHAQLHPCADFFVTGDTDRLVYCPTDAVAQARCRLGAAATVVDGGRLLEMCRLSEDLHARGVGRLMVEGGGSVPTSRCRCGSLTESTPPRGSTPSTGSPTAGSISPWGLAIGGGICGSGGPAAGPDPQRVLHGRRARAASGACHPPQLAIIGAGK